MAAARSQQHQNMSEALPPKTRVIGRYSILRELRRERHSVSYAAVDPVMNRQLVIKAVELLPAGPKLSSEERRRVEHAFVRQAQAAGRLQHPHIVTVFDAGLSHAFGFLVIERINGRPLHELIAGGLRPAFVQCASIAARIADALECAHSNGVAHGHLGPQHVYLLADGSPKVSGFGGWIDDGASGDEALAGTARLLPFFQNEITEETRQRDIRAIGELLFMMLVGRAAPDTRGANGAGASRNGASPTLAARPDTPPVLARMVDQALLAGPGIGPKTAGAMRDALTSFIWNERTENVAPSTLGIPLAAPPQRPAVHVATLEPAQESTPSRETAPTINLTVVSGDLPAEAPKSKAGGDAPTLDKARADAPTLNKARAEAVMTKSRSESKGAKPTHSNSLAAKPVPKTVTTSTAALVADPMGPDWRALLERLRPWALRHRVPIFSAGALLSAGIFLGVILGNVRHAETSPNPAATATAAPSGAPRADTSTGGVAPVSLDIRPWGEVFVDGKAAGVSPPLNRIELPTGHHHIEVRHAAAPAWRTEIDVQGGAANKIEHQFE